MAFRHVVMFRFADDTSDEQRRALARRLDGLPAATGVVRPEDYRHGSDAGINEGNWDYVVVADFASAEDYVAYRDHPEHQALLREVLKPIVTDRAAVQYEIAG